MSKGPEANFWNMLRPKLPKRCAATRLENRHGGGVPDLHLMWDGLDLWIELKAKSLKVLDNPPEICDHTFTMLFDAQILRDSQRAWHSRHYSTNGLSFVLARDPTSKQIHLLRPVIEQNALILGEIWVGRDPRPMFQALRLSALDHLRLVCDHAAQDL